MSLLLNIAHGFMKILQCVLPGKTVPKMCRVGR